LGYEGEQTCTPSTETEDTASETGEDTGTATE
jgi:hypothetical protein